MILYTTPLEFTERYLSGQITFVLLQIIFILMYINTVQTLQHLLKPFPSKT